MRVKTLMATSGWCRCWLITSYWQAVLLYCLHSYTTFSLSVSLPVFFCLSLLDSFAAALSETVLVIEDMLTSVDRYWLPKPQHLSGSCVSTCTLCVYLCAHICWCMSKMFGTQDKHTPRLLSFNSSCPWGWQLSLHGYAGALVCSRVYMMDLAISLWGIIWTASTAIFLHEYLTII